MVYLLRAAKVKKPKKPTIKEQELAIRAARRQKKADEKQRIIDEKQRVIAEKQQSAEEDRRRAYEISIADWIDERITPSENGYPAESLFHQWRMWASMNGRSSSIPGLKVAAQRERFYEILDARGYRRIVANWCGHGEMVIYEGIRASGRGKSDSLTILPF